MFKKLLAIFTPWRVRPTESTASTRSSMKRVTDPTPGRTLAAPVDVPPATWPVDNLPAASHPAWRHLLDHQVRLETKDLALQMMLSWMWGQLQPDASEAAKLQKINVLRMYFKKNQHVLQKELKQLFG
jgi:hypothetical protein